MPSAKSGTANNLISPAAPRAAIEADDAVAGAVDQAGTGLQSSKSGKPSSTPAKPFKPSSSDDPSTPPKTGWVEVQMVDETGAPVAGLAYSITMPDGSVAEGTLDENGLVRVEGFDPGSCQVTFPGLDKDAWEAQ